MTTTTATPTTTVADPSIPKYSHSALADAIRYTLQTYRDGGQAKGRHTYLDDIDSMMPLGKTSITARYVDLVATQDFESEFIRDPDTFLSAAAEAVKSVLRVRQPEYAMSIDDEISIRITEYPLRYTVRQISSKNTGSFVRIRAMIIKMSVAESIPSMAVYACRDGHETVSITGANYAITKPAACDNKTCKHRDLELIARKSKFVDYQILQMQELPGELPPGSLPKTLGVFVSGDLVDSARMGDIVDIAGVIRPELSKEIKLGTPVQTYRHRLYANSIERMASEDDGGGNITEADTKKITDMVKNARSEEDAARMITGSFAPHIHGHTLIREALIYTMIGSDAQVLRDGTNVRGDINTFLVGDPGTGKSEMGKAAYRVAPRAFFASGRRGN